MSQVVLVSNVRYPHYDQGLADAILDKANKEDKFPWHIDIRTVTKAHDKSVDDTVRGFITILALEETARLSLPTYLCNLSSDSQFLDLAKRTGGSYLTIFDQVGDNAMSARIESLARAKRELDPVVYISTEIEKITLFTHRENLFRSISGVLNGRYQLVIPTRDTGLMFLYYPRNQHDSEIATNQFIARDLQAFNLLPEGVVPDLMGGIRVFDRELYDDFANPDNIPLHLPPDFPYRGAYEHLITPPVKRLKKWKEANIPWSDKLGLPTINYIHPWLQSSLEYYGKNPDYFDKRWRQANAVYIQCAQEIGISREQAFFNAFRLQEVIDKGLPRYIAEREFHRAYGNLEGTLHGYQHRK